MNCSKVCHCSRDGVMPIRRREGLMPPERRYRLRTKPPLRRIGISPIL